MQQNENFAKQAEQAEAERPEVVAYLFVKPDGTLSMDAVRHKPSQPAVAVMTVAQHERIVGELRAENAEWQEAAGRSRSDVVAYIAERAKLLEERAAALVEVERLRESKGDPVGSLEKCMKVMYERDEHAKQLEAALARVAELEKELAMARDAASKGDAARHAAGGMEMEIQELREKVTELQKKLRSRWTYASTQATNCAGCGEHKHTPLRVDWMGGYVCLTCIDKKLEELHDAQTQHSVPEGWMLVECGIWTQEQVDEMQKTVARFRNSELVDDRALAMAVADAGQCKAPEISLAELLAAAPGNSAQHSVPEGWKLVPLEAPVEMLRAGSIALGMEPLSDGSDGGYPITGQQSTIRQCYAAMLAAAPGKEGV
ncbi:hypothetical protein [Pseudomonas aeruginosa]|uniref:hypothetical protein n=1 Tax=Pseudomonas aeruginosa TaxID=287 RepID=UPI0018FE8FB5|nr:hypothetical protein [Pseudomonas aeruginosa]MBI8446133.1 hypothetical protein [Pseudomonas aeruginosa]HDX6350148.1 hypothetical protein [Pseudomonas aeruginosa]HEO1644859.1 hypothetical protein [Pseudomonas aeruginosa]